MGIISNLLKTFQEGYNKRTMKQYEKEQKKIQDRLDAHKEKWADSDAMDVILGKKKKMDHPIKK
jgi:hypothetical protein